MHKSVMTIPRRNKLLTSSKSKTLLTEESLFSQKSQTLLPFVKHKYYQSLDTSEQPESTIGEEEQVQIWNSVQQKFFRAKKLDNHHLELNKLIKKKLFELELQCEREKKQTQKDFESLDDALERVNFRKRRMDFVTQILQEFDNLDPSALDIIFEY